MLLIVLALIVWIAILYDGRGRDRRRLKQLQDQIDALRRNCLEFITNYEAVAKTKAEKSLLKRMQADYRGWQGLPAPGQPAATPAAAATPATGETALAPNVAPPPLPAAAPAATAAVKSSLDNASLLLYFGAFLFVASAGLFVAFGGAAGAVKTLIVLLVSLVMYAGGIWLYCSRPRLRRAGQAFAGIGVVLAPLVGAALYAYAFAHQHGPLVWLLTSVFCMALYLHALAVFRTTLMGYVLVFTFLSLFESGIGISGAPLYYFGWGLAAVALLLLLGNRLRGWHPELREPSLQSSQAFMPLALAVALVDVPALGASQLGVSLLLASLYYGLEAWRARAADRELYAVASQATANAAVGALAYGSSHNVTVALYAMMAAVAIQLAVLAAGRPKDGRLARLSGSTLMVVMVVVLLLALGSPAAMMTAAGLLALLGGVLWLKQRRADAYGVAGLSLIALPFIYGQLVTAAMPATGQTALGLAALGILLTVQLTAKRWAQAAVAGWGSVSEATYLTGLVAVLAASLFMTPYQCLLAVLALVASVVLLAERDRQTDWLDAGALVLLVPLVRAFTAGAALLVAAAVVLAMLVGLTLRYRRELLRWAGTAVALLMPYAAAQATGPAHWSAAGYAWAYLAVMAALVLARAIARGVLLFSSKVVVSSLSRQASMAYVAGYLAAGLAAVLTSLPSGNSQLHTTALLALVCAILLVLSRYVEKRRDILLLLPLLLQALLLSAIRPAAYHQSLEVFLTLSIVVALLLYDELHARLAAAPDLRPALQAALATAFVTPAAAIAAPLVWPMPAGLLVAGAMLLHYNWRARQSSREWSAVVLALGVWLGLAWAGVHQFQAYSHTAVATLAVLAYWRNRRGETAVANQYLWAMLAVATVPLAIQALASESGGLYGWWLLLEQVVIMLLGMSIKRHFVTMWGLYVAVAAVLYQLRSLGYAALAFLALFLIGLAVYRLQKDSRHGGESRR